MYYFMCENERYILDHVTERVAKICYERKENMYKLIMDLISVPSSSILEPDFHLTRSEV